MAIRPEILLQIQTFLNQKNKQKKDYRLFIGQFKKMKDALFWSNLTTAQLTTCQQAQEFLAN
jgi:hypothetical protein